MEKTIYMLRNTGGHYKLEERPETDSPSNLSQRTNPTNTSTSNFWLPCFIIPCGLVGISKARIHLFFFNREWYNKLVVYCENNKSKWMPISWISTEHVFTTELKILSHILYYHIVICSVNMT